MRLDKFLADKKIFASREKAQTAIKEGQVFVDGKIVKDCAYLVGENSEIRLENSHNYVSRGAHKLAGAIKSFNLDFNGKIVLDIGASTGGFTQVALDNGAKKVYALDVGSGQLADVLKQDSRVEDLSHTDFRTSQKLEDVNFIVSDLSFISLRHIIPKMIESYNGVEAMLLFKPQFECGPIVAKKYNGVIKDRKIHQKLLDDFTQYLTFFHIKISGLTNSPITGKSGNIEYLFHLNGEKSSVFDVKKIVESAFSALK